MINPIVSVIVPCYNHINYVKECIESILNQTYKNIELIVIDDGSKDQSVGKLLEIQRQHNFILIQQENRGLAATLNRGISEFASGKYLTLCASDDFWCIDKIEKQVAFMEKYNDVAMCYGRTYYVDEESNKINLQKRSDNKLRGGHIFEDIFLFKFHPPVNYLFKKSLFAEIGLYDESIYAEDYYMNLKIARKYKIGFLDDYLGYYRVDSNSEKIIRFEKVSNSHLQSILEYKDHHLFKEAVLTVFLRKFFVFSEFKNHKLLAISNMFKCGKLFYHKRFLLSCFRLVFSWK